jgi:hypothetical protein
MMAWGCFAAAFTAACIVLKGLKSEPLLLSSPFRSEKSVGEECMRGEYERECMRESV